MTPLAKIGAVTWPQASAMSSMRPAWPRRERGAMDERLRGRAGQAARKRRLAAHPICARCDEMGFLTQTYQIDHITPITQGGADTDDNVQGLCLEHHAEKTAAEDASHQGAQNHPTWLSPSAVPLVIITGPPAAGKSTYVADHAGPQDIIIDIDQIMARLTGKPGHRRGTADLDPAIRVRNQMLGALSRASAPMAFFVVSAPYPAERQWWADTLGGAIVVMDPGEGECIRRAVERGTPWHCPIIHRWYQRSRMTWTVPERRGPAPAIRMDGRPEGWGDD